MLSTLLKPKSLLAIALVLFVCSPAAAQDRLDRLLDACARGDQKACQEIQQLSQQNRIQLDKLNWRAEAFQKRAGSLGIQTGPVPILKKAYPLILKDYLESDVATPSHRQRGMNLIGPCSEQFHDFWIHQRREWPTLPSNQPDWQVVYLQVLDHYFRFCSK